MNVWKAISLNIFALISLLSGVVIKPVLPIDYSYYETHRTY